MPAEEVRFALRPGQSLARKTPVDSLREERVVCAASRGAVFEYTSGVDSCGGVDVFRCEALMWGRISKNER